MEGEKNRGDNHWFCQFYLLHFNVIHFFFFVIIISLFDLLFYSCRHVAFRFGKLPVLPLPKTQWSTIQLYRLPVWSGLVWLTECRLFSSLRNCFHKSPSFSSVSFLSAHLLMVAVWNRTTVVRSDRCRRGGSRDSVFRPTELWERLMWRSIDGRDAERCFENDLCSVRMVVCGLLEDRRLRWRLEVS